MQLLEEGAKSLGIHLSERQLAQFELYYMELAAWNRQANLTAITGYEETQVRHFLDSLTVCLPFRHDDGLPFEGLSHVERVVDVGSGAGFPGLPLKLAFPHIELHLVESVGKKTAFLEHVAGQLGLNGVVVHQGRAENAGPPAGPAGVIRPGPRARRGQDVAAAGVHAAILPAGRTHGSPQARQRAG